MKTKLIVSKMPEKVADCAFAVKRDYWCGYDCKLNDSCYLDSKRECPYLQEAENTNTKKVRCSEEEIQVLPWLIKCNDTPIEDVYNIYYDTAGNLHWIGTKSGEHIIRNDIETIKLSNTER